MNETQNTVTPTWIKADLKLADILDNRIIELLGAIEQSGSLNQAAKQVGLSYKGAWQIIERVNNSAPKTLITTTTGGTKGGGSSLTETGRALLSLFKEVQQQHNAFLSQLNQNLAKNSDMVLLLQRLVVKTSAENQLFGQVIKIQYGLINVEVVVELKSGEQITTTIDTDSLQELELKTGSEAVLLIPHNEILLVKEPDATQFSARNCLIGNILLIQQHSDLAKITVLLKNGDTLVSWISKPLLPSLSLEIEQTVFIFFKTNAPVLGVKR